MNQMGDLAARSAITHVTRGQDIASVIGEVRVKNLHMGYEGGDVEADTWTLI
jgi:hypothetical protein